MWQEKSEVSQASASWSSHVGKTDVRQRNKWSWCVCDSQVPGVCASVCVCVNVCVHMCEREVCEWLIWRKSEFVRHYDFELKDTIFRNHTVCRFLLMEALSRNLTYKHLPDGGGEVWPQVPKYNTPEVQIQWRTVADSLNLSLYKQEFSSVQFSHSVMSNSLQPHE